MLIGVKLIGISDNGWCKLKVVGSNSIAMGVNRNSHLILTTIVNFHLGIPKLITADMVKEGAMVIDIGKHIKDSFLFTQPPSKGTAVNLSSIERSSELLYMVGLRGPEACPLLGGCPFL